VQAQAEGAAGTDTVQPFRVNVPEDQLVDLRRRLAATRWPDRETVSDESQGVQLATMQELARYWATGYDWRKCEAKLNALPQFMTEIDGLNIHFIHVRSKHDNALPLIVTHGWPGSVCLHDLVEAHIGICMEVYRHSERSQALAIHSMRCPQ
jgi:hypothetical protein